MPDAQAGHEKTLTALLPALAGANLVYGMGMLEMGQVLSFSQMVMDNELAAMIKRSICGIKVNDELMAVDVIKRVGIGGNFLGQQHTLDHLEDEQVQADMIDRRMRGGWEKRGAKDLHQASVERAKKILETHQPKPLEAGLAEELVKIAKSAE
ncbi:MAG: trimethylamine methyltransferase family protein [Deltaproteobacteria bacterium]|nr:trimethylamine methyltransferase family protein [Deltaproteobacteria bacterium]MBW2543703.1 trimethylamine methyltransferase family protein [Deltaproteobacteria bacterium]